MTKELSISMRDVNYSETLYSVLLAIFGVGSKEKPYATCSAWLREMSGSKGKE